MPLNISNSTDYFEQGMALQRAGRLAEAEQLYISALRINPRHGPSLHNGALIALSMGRTDIAFERIRQAIAIEESSDRWNTLGEIYRAMLKGFEAIDAYDKAIAMDPRNARAWNNRGIVKANLGNVTEAIESWRKVLEITENDPGLADCRASAFNNLGNMHLELAETKKAVEAHEQTLQIQPEYVLAISNLLRDYNHLPDMAPEELRLRHEQLVARATKNIVPVEHPKPADPDRRLRVAFYSSDFREHAVAYFLMPLFEHYDRSQFEFICLANINFPDRFTAWFNDHAAAVHVTHGLNDLELARLIKDQKIDIAVDLAGHTAGGRFRTFAFKPAPLQVAYLGYPATLGLPQMDYRITDALADPPGMTESHFVEKLVRLDRPAWCYRPPAQVVANELPPSPRTGAPFTFGSFNNFAKATDDIVRTWSTILHQVPGSRLLLKASIMPDAGSREYVLARFAKHGIPADRFLLRGRVVSTADHLAQYNDVDLALDTFPYNGTTTTCEALYMNVPVVALIGNTHMARVGISLLTGIGLPQLATRTVEDYIGTAVQLATNPAALKELRTGLRQRLEQSPLRNEQDFAQKFCLALRTLWQHECQ